MVGDILQPTHLLFVLVVALLVLGPKRLPEVGRALGRGLRDFRSAMSGEERSEAIPPANDPAPAPTAVHEPPESGSPSFAAEPEEASDNGSPAHSETEAATQASEPVEAVTSASSSDSSS